jgi:hypothetical protein
MQYYCIKPKQAEILGLQSCDNSTDYPQPHERVLPHP